MNDTFYVCYSVCEKKDTSLLDAFVGILYIIYSLFINLIARKLLDIVQGVFWWSEREQEGVGMIKAYENQQKVIFEGVGEYGIPEI